MNIYMMLWCCGLGLKCKIVRFKQQSLIECLHIPGPGFNCVPRPSLKSGLGRRFMSLIVVGSRGALVTLCTVSSLFDLNIQFHPSPRQRLQRTRALWGRLVAAVLLHCKTVSEAVSSFRPTRLWQQHKADKRGWGGSRRAPWPRGCVPTTKRRCAPSAGAKCCCSLSVRMPQVN